VRSSKRGEREAAVAAGEGREAVGSGLVLGSEHCDTLVSIAIFVAIAVVQSVHSLRLRLHLREVLLQQDSKYRSIQHPASCNPYFYHPFLLSPAFLWTGIGRGITITTNLTLRRMTVVIDSTLIPQLGRPPLAFGLPQSLLLTLLPLCPGLLLLRRIAWTIVELQIVGLGVNRQVLTSPTTSLLHQRPALPRVQLSPQPVALLPQERMNLQFIFSHHQHR
jgi:hypothetical protein